MPTKQPDPELTGVLKRLDELAARIPDRAEPAAFYKAILPVLHQAQADVEHFELAPEIAQQKLELGNPVLVDEDLPLDLGATQDLFIHLCRAVETLDGASNRRNGQSRARNPIGQFFFSPRKPDQAILIERAQNGDGAALRSAAAEQIRRAVETNVLSLPSLWALTAAGDWLVLEQTAVRHQLDFALLSLLIRTSLKPALQVWARDLKQSVDFDQWRRGVCPLCGSLPLLSEIQGKDGERRLRCGLCGADWAYSRLQCAFCGNRDYKTLGHITVTGEEDKYRLQTCDECRGYLKVVVTFEPMPVDMLLVEDLATLHLDLIAADYQYARTSANASNFDL